MKKIITAKRFVFAAFLLLAAAMETSAQTAYNNVWVRATVYPAGAGQVYVDWGLDEVIYQSEYSEFKRSASLAASTGFILAKPADGYLFAGVARDMNHNGQFDNNTETDKQVHVWSNHYFDCFYDHTDYFVSGSSTESMELAEEALAAMTTPTDQLFAVFTKGTAATRATGEENHGYVFISKLDNQVGDQVTVWAYGDYESTDEGNKYYKFDHWANAAGETLSTSREYTFTVQGTETIYAHYAQTTKKDYQDNEKVPDRFKFDYNNQDWDPAGINTVSTPDKADGTVYDLQGRRVAQPAKGLFIQNGKKVMVK